MVKRQRFPEFFTTQAIIQTFKEKIATTKARGTDGIDIVSFEKQLDNHAEVIRRKVIGSSYEFTRYKEKLISKGAAFPPREVCIPTIRDKNVLRCLLNYIEVQFPEARSRRPHVYIKDLKQRLLSASDDDCFVRIDIKDFYPTIDHKKLMARLRTKVRSKQAISLVKSAIETSCKKESVRTRGIPQGLSISNHLSNLLLVDLDQQFSHEFGANNYFRYVDDVLVIAHKDETEARFSRVEKVLKRRRLQVHPLDGEKGKSLINSVAEGVDYLGFRISPARISVRRSSLRRMYETVSSVITSAKYNKNLGRMCFKLDIKITGCILGEKRFGWLYFFQQMDDVSQLVQLDAFVTRMLKRIRDVPQGYIPKRFVKAYHEIRYNSDKTTYIPNFDENSREEKIRVLIQLAPSKYQKIENEKDEEIDRIFFLEMSRITSELERDLQEPNS
jgi:RNA-directed DNA polymerase